MIDPIQQQLIAARRNQILDAAAVVFAEKGFHPTTIRDVAKQAGIADGTIYNYFDSKSALLLGIFERMRDSIMAQNPVPVPDQLDFPTFIRLFLSQPLMVLKQDNFGLFRIIVSEMMVNEELRDLYYQQVLEPTLMMAEAFFGEQAAKLGMSEIEAKLTVRAISSMMMGLMLEHIMGDSTLIDHWETVPDVLTNLLLNGLQHKP
jgi:AcrR family transcriptional regulator